MLPSLLTTSLGLDGRNTASSIEHMGVTEREKRAQRAFCAFQAPGSELRLVSVWGLRSVVSLFRIGEENTTVGQDDAFESKLASLPLDGGRSRY